MTHQQLVDLFKSAHPKAVDIPLSVYQGSEGIINAWARSLGYRFVGERLGRAVFTTKPERGG